MEENLAALARVDPQNPYVDLEGAELRYLRHREPAELATGERPSACCASFSRSGSSSRGSRRIRTGSLHGTPQFKAIVAEVKKRIGREATAGK